jgi:hypothetical protein
MNAPLGAIGAAMESRRCAAGEQPLQRFLDRSWFMGPERMKDFLSAESTLAFRRRLIFAEAEPLRRTGTPRDGRWWAYATIRSGLTPTAEEEQEFEQARTRHLASKELASRRSGRRSPSSREIGRVSTGCGQPVENKWTIG